MGKLSNFFSSQKIALAIEQRRQMVALDTEFEELQSKVTILQADNLKLRAQIEPLKKEIERLKNQIKNVSAQDHAVTLDPAADNILLALANGESDREHIFAKLNIPKLNGDHLYDILEERKLIEYLFGMASVTPLGRAYLVQKTRTETEQPDNPKGHRCDHCGGSQLKRTGSRPDPKFSAVGIKEAVYSCLSCNKESAFTNDES